MQHVLSCKAVFLDGFLTLFDADGLAQRAVLAAARHLPVDDAEAFGRAWLQTSARQQWHKGSFRPMRTHFQDSLRQTLCDWGIDVAEARVRAAVDANIATIAEVRPYPEARDLLQLLRRHYKTVLVSNADNDFLALVLKQLPDGFDHVVSSEAAEAYKPEPRIFQHAAREVGYDLHQVLMIGDSWELDVMGARRAGAAAIWINRRGEPLPQSETSPVPGALITVCSDLAEVWTWFRRVDTDGLVRTIHAD